MYLLREDLALVQTVDFFTPVVDDPVAFGMIAAANAMSDIYAMGAAPLTALNVVCFPQTGPPGSEVLEKILQGGHQKAAEAGVAIIGGHTIDDREPKYGLAVMGVCHPDELFALGGASEGDLLVLTKPLGTGIIATAIKAGAQPPGAEAALVETAASLNRNASQVARRLRAHAVTDVTGFGLVLHAMDILRASEAGAELWMDQLPLLPGVRECLDKGLVPGGSRRNLKRALALGLSADSGVDEQQALLANDAQTSGGLLMALDPQSVGQARDELLESGVQTAAVVGRVTAQSGHVLLKLSR